MPDYTPSYTPLERSSGTYGSRTSLLNIQEAPVTSRYLQVQYCTVLGYLKPVYCKVQL